MHACKNSEKEVPGVQNPRTLRRGCSITEITQAVLVAPAADVAACISLAARQNGPHYVLAF